MKKKESTYKVGDRIKIRSREWYEVEEEAVFIHEGMIEGVVL